MHLNLIRQLKEQGVIYNSSCGISAPHDEAYFEDGKKFDIPITYSLENEPLGTAGLTAGFKRSR